MMKCSTFSLLYLPTKLPLYLSIDCQRETLYQVHLLGSARRQPIAYVVAFMGGGAKDVTRRYVRSLLRKRALNKSTLSC